MKPIRFVFVIALTAVGAVAVLVAAALAAQPNAPSKVPIAIRGNFDFAKASTFEGFELFAPGATFKGVPLVAVTRVLGEPNPRIPEDLKPRRANWVNFIYASGCAAQGADVGCERMAQVQVWPACERNRSVYARALRTGDVEIVMTNIRSAPAAYFENEQMLEVYSGDSTIVLFADNTDDLFALAESVASVNSAKLGRSHVNPRDALPPPAAGSLNGQLGCSGRESSR